MNTFQTVQTTHLWRRVHTRDEPRALAIAIVVLQQQLARLLIQRRLRIWVDEQTLHSHKDVPNPIARLPVLLERVDTDLACGRDVGVKDLRREPA